MQERWMMEMKEEQKSLSSVFCKVPGALPVGRMSAQNNMFIHVYLETCHCVKEGKKPLSHLPPLRVLCMCFRG